MIYFAQRRFEIESSEQAAKFLNQATTKVKSMFDLTATSAYVILEERPLIGQKLTSGDTLVSRMRHSFFRLVPRVVSRWNTESVDGKSYLLVKHRLALFPTLVLSLVLFSLVVACVTSIANMKLPDLEALAISVFLLLILMTLTKYEVDATDKTIVKVIKNEKVKSLVTV
jgi:hypothetical protein